jgi:predicted nuclease of predicted toxin-antitoxin system
MNLLANENFPRLAVEALREAGHDVLWARTDMQGADDDIILQRAQDDGRLLVTFDKDFGELAFRSGLPATCGIVLFRLKMLSPEHVERRVCETSLERSDWTGQFFVVAEHRIRVRPLPSVGN